MSKPPPRASAGNLLDELGFDGFRYDPDWSLRNPLQQLFGQKTLSRVSVAMPLGMDFVIYIISGWDDDETPHLDLTLSREGAYTLAQQLRNSKIVEVRNKSLWSGSRKKRYANPDR